MPSFEYDDSKSRSKRAKHGLDFEEAEALWKDLNGLEAPVRSHPEPQFSFTAKLPDLHLWTAILTYRENRIRIFCVRRAAEKG